MGLEMDELDLEAGNQPALAPATPAIPVSTRLRSIDLVRGLVMVLMALDHTRGFFSNAEFDPTDLSKTTSAYFLTRWITHYCAPTFMFLAGIGAFQAGRNRSSAALSNFLWTRGLWLIFIEFTVVHFGWEFNNGYMIDKVHGVGGSVLWALGCSMIFLSILVRFPSWVSAIIGLIMIVLHNAYDGMGIDPGKLLEADGNALFYLESIWAVLHSGFLVPIGKDFVFAPNYPLIPWLGVMAVGYAIGPVFAWPTKERRSFLIFLGLSLIAAFIALRYTNKYGDRRPWSEEKDAAFTIFSWLNCWKYPPSLLYLLMTLGPSLTLLGLFEFVPDKPSRWLLYFGRVPMFFYIIHIYLIHAVAAGLAYLRFGVPMWDLKTYNDSRPEMGYNLWVVYAIWIGVILVLYLPCRWFAGVKARHKSAWLSYL
jgi:uncharacterized membrane protein